MFNPATFSALLSLSLIYPLKNLHHTRRFKSRGPTSTVLISIFFVKKHPHDNHWNMITWYFRKLYVKRLKWFIKFISRISLSLNKNSKEIIQKTIIYFPDCKFDNLIKSNNIVALLSKSNYYSTSITLSDYSLEYILNLMQKIFREQI